MSRRAGLDNPVPDEVLDALGLRGQHQPTGALDVEAADGTARFVMDWRNRRVKAIGIRSDDLERGSVRRLRDLVDRAASTGIDKLIVYARGQDQLPWIRAGMIREGHIEGFFADREPAHLWAKFGGARDQSADEARHHEVVVGCLRKEVRTPPPETPGYSYLRFAPQDVARFGPILRAAFPEYPSPLEDPILVEDIHSGARVFAGLLSESGEVAAVASAEVDAANGSAEMTDCVTAPAHRGHGLMAQLLWQLEAEVHDLRGITDLYTLARAGEVGMNSTFARLGYNFAGRLINNCRMPTGWESMNVWCRSSAPRFVPEVDNAVDR